MRHPVPSGNPSPLDDRIAAERAACPDTHSEAWRHRCEVFHCARLGPEKRRAHFQGMREKHRDLEQVAALEAAVNALLCELGASAHQAPAKHGQAGKPAAFVAAHGSPWTAELDRALKEMAQPGTSVHELSGHFGRSPRAIEMRLERLGIRTPAKAA